MISGPVASILQQLPPYLGEERLIKRKQATYDIMSEILKMHEKCAKDYDKIAEPFWKGSVEKTAENLFHFLKENVIYGVEPGNYQSVKTPSAILAEGMDHGGDCKHYSLFIVGISKALKRLGYPIDAFYRFAAYNSDRYPGHVFAVIIDTSTGQEYWTDPVLPYFNARKPKFTHKIDKHIKDMDGKVGELYAINGIGVGCPGGHQKDVHVRRVHYLEEVYWKPRHHSHHQHITSHWLDRPHHGHDMGNVDYGQIGWGFSDLRKKFQEVNKRTLNNFKHFNKELMKTAKKVSPANVLKKVDQFNRHLANEIKHINVGDLVKKFLGGGPMLAFVGLLHMNMFGLAQKLNGAIGINMPKVKAWWESLGGDWKMLHHAVQSGTKFHNSGHSKQFQDKINGLDYYNLVSGINMDPQGGGNLNSMVIMSGFDSFDDIGNPYDAINGVNDYPIVAGTAYYEQLGFTPENMIEGQIGVVQFALPAIIAAASPIIALVAKLLGGMGGNANTAVQAAAQATTALVQSHNAAGTSGNNIDDSGVVHHGSGVMTNVTVDPNTGEKSLQIAVNPMASVNDSPLQSMVKTAAAAMVPEVAQAIAPQMPQQYMQAAQAAAQLMPQQYQAPVQQAMQFMQPQADQPAPEPQSMLPMAPPDGANMQVMAPQGEGINGDGPMAIFNKAKAWAMEHKKIAIGVPVGIIGAIIIYKAISGGKGGHRR